MKEVTLERYIAMDRILRLLSLPNPCEVRIEVTKKCVFLFVGQRDWQWSRETGELVGFGINMSSQKGEGDEK